MSDHETDDMTTTDAVEAAKEALKRAKKTEKQQAKLRALRGDESPGLEAILDHDLRLFGEWVEGVGAEYVPRDHSFTYRNGRRSPGEMADIVDRALSNPNFSPGSNIAAVLYADQCRQSYVDALREAVPLEGDGNDAPKRFLTFLLQREPSTLDEAVFRHWIWQIKRRIHHKQTEWEMMLLFTGGQGWGKTRHLERLFRSIGPLPHFIAKGQRFKIFNDDFGRAIFNQCFIIPFEEMSGAKNVDMENLKMMITETEVTARIMRAEQFRTLRMNASFYGTSNMPGGASLVDESGMRRFWAYECPKLKFEEAVHLPQLRALGDLSLVFAAVDATTDASPIRPHLDALSGEQDRQFSNHGALHDFFQECASTEGDGWVPRSDVWDEFVRWKGSQAAYDREKLKKTDMDGYVRKFYGADAIKRHASASTQYRLRIVTLGKE